MTLALACLTPEFVTLVADRRVTLGSDVLDDVATKVVVVCDRGGIAYSGLARFPMRGRRLDHWPRMDEWIVSTLSKYKVATIAEAAKVLRTEATEAFRQLAGSLWQHQHVFMMAGWSVSKSGNRRRLSSGGNSARLKAARLIVVMRRPPKSPDESSPIIPLAKFTRSILPSSIVFRICIVFSGLVSIR